MLALYIICTKAILVNDYSDTELLADYIEMLIALRTLQVAHLCPEEQNESKAIKKETGSQVQGLWDGAVPSGLLEWQAALSPPHVAPFSI